MSPRLVLTALISSTALCGCVSLYHHPAGAPHAKVNLSFKGTPGGSSFVTFMCLDNRQYRLDSDPSGYAVIPVGQRISLDVLYHGYRLSCVARSAFLPTAGGSYYVDFQLEAERCTALVYREVSTSRTGLGFEPTLTPAQECQRR